MPQTCTICRHTRRQEIEEALLAGDSLRNIAKRFGTSPSALLRHKSHLPASLVKANDAREAARADGLLAKVREMEAEARRIGRKAEHEGDLRCAIASIKQVVEIVELMARLLDAFPKADGKDAHPPGSSSLASTPRNSDPRLSRKR
jgi:hypothetical protein